MNNLATFEAAHRAKDVVDVRPGYQVRVYLKIQEGDKERVQIFEGIVIAVNGGKGISGTFTVRKIASGVGVERVFPLHSPKIEKIEVVKANKVRRSKLYFLRSSKKKVKFREDETEFAKISARVAAEEQAAEEAARKAEEEKAAADAKKKAEEEAEKKDVKDEKAE